MLVLAAQIVQAFARVGMAEFGDSRGAVMTLQATYRADGETGRQGLHDQVANCKVPRLKNMILRE